MKQECLTCGGTGWIHWRQPVLWGDSYDMTNCSKVCPNCPPYWERKKEIIEDQRKGEG